MLDLLRLSLQSPREAAARVMALGLSAREAIEAQLLVAAAGGLAVGVATRGRLEIPTVEGEAVVIGPLAYAAILAVFLIMGSATLTAAGRMLGGRGTFPGALALVAWLQAVDLALQAVLALTAVLLPPLLPIAALAILGLVVWVALGFAQELHGLTPGRAAATLVLAAIGLGLGAAILLSLVWSPAHA